MPFDPTLSTNPAIRKQAAPQIAQQADHERQVLRQQADQKRAEEQAAREAEKIQRATAKQQQVNDNITAETASETSAWLNARLVGDPPTNSCDESPTAP